MLQIFRSFFPFKILYEGSANFTENLKFIGDKILTWRKLNNNNNNNNSKLYSVILKNIVAKALCALAVFTCIVSVSKLIEVLPPKLGSN